MKIEDELYMIQRHYGPAGTQPEFPSVRDHDIWDVVDAVGDALEQGKSIIQPGRSEQQVHYSMDGHQRHATVPLRTTFDKHDGVVVHGYSLRNQRLEMKLQDYKNYPDVSGDKIGGNVNVAGGVYCAISIWGGDEEADLQEQLLTIKQTVRQFYEPLPGRYLQSVIDELHQKQGSPEG